MSLQVHPLGPGLWRWTAPHPAWTPAADRPDGWARTVGCVYYEPGDASGIVLIDPLAPSAGSADAERFWSALDRDVARLACPVRVLIANAWHARSADEIHSRYAERFGATIHVHADAVGRATCESTHTFRAGEALPGGVEAIEVEGFDHPELVLHLAPHQALIFADAVIGAGAGEVRVAPRSWAPEGDAATERYDRLFRSSLARLVTLEPRLLLTSHGEPVLDRGAQALARALAAPPWGHS